MRPRTLLVVPVALVALAACTDASRETPAGGTARTPPPEGSATLGALCQEIHAVYDALVSSDPRSQNTFLAQVQRISDASTHETRVVLAPLVSAGRTLVEAGVGPGFYEARDGVHAAVVSVDAACVDLGSPILHR